MTFIPLAQLQSRRDQGISPQGGPAPKEAVLQALEVPADAKIAKLDALLALQWNHPGDEALMFHLSAVVGHRHSRAEILTAAQYVRSVKTGRDFSALDEQAYKRLAESVQAPQ